MSKSQPSNSELARRLEPWYPVFAAVGTAVQRDFLAAISILGLPRKTERANDMHRAWRTNLRQVCDYADPMITIVEEPDGQGLDYILFNDDNAPFAVRWGRFNGETVRRNRTDRNEQIQEQGVFNFALSEPAGGSEMPIVTLAHTIEDEHTEGGRSCLWIGRLLLLRERFAESEVITEVHVYSKPEPENLNEFDTPAPVVEARQEEAMQLKRMIKRIRRSA
jgi:hypothetical protein